MQRHGRLDQLSEAIIRARPYISWDQLTSPSTINETSLDEAEDLKMFYDQINRLQKQFQELQDLTGLNDEETQKLLNLLEDAPHELLRDLLTRYDDANLEKYAQDYAKMEHKLGITLVAQGKWYAGLRRFERSLTIRRILDVSLNTLYCASDERPRWFIRTLCETAVSGG
ncbi:MAG: hypothetical protein HC804_13150 [Anaerolineae bacterium]|nr:hypothetical protein [Anaerolineae bacterium]